MTGVVHAITPGDHFSPRTGSAIPTVVHGLATASGRDEREPRYTHRVLVGHNTFRPRYASADAIEFTPAPAPSTRERVSDALLARLGAPRHAAVRYFIPQAEALKRVDESVVLAHNAPALPALLAGTQHSVVLYAHNDILRTVSSREAQKTLAGVAAIVCVSAFLAEQTAARLPSSLAQRVHAVGNGVDCAQFTPGNAAQNERLRVLFVGRMIPQKGADLLLKAAALLRRDDLELVLVGSRGFDSDAPLTRYERRLRELAEQCSAAVRFEPFVARDRLPELFRQADLLVVPSRWDEPSGLTVSEGQASGLPVIASRVGGIPEVVGSAGMLVDAEAGAFAEAMAALADDAALRRRMAQEARRHAERHDWAWSWSGLRRVLGGL